MAEGEGNLTVGLSRPEQRLSHALKELSRRWDETSPYWRDDARSAFQKAFIDEFIASARGGTSAMTEIQRFLRQAIRECG